MTRPHHPLVATVAICMLVLANDIHAQESSLFHQSPSLVAPSGAFMAPDGSPSSTSAYPPSREFSQGSDYARGDGVSRAPYGASPEMAQSLSTASWTFQPSPPMRVFNKNDIITIRVDEIGRLLAQGNAQKRRSGQYTAILTDWLKLTDGRIIPDPQEEGDPAVGYNSTDSVRNQATIESRETLTFNIAATIVDIRPNGNLVLEARKSIRASDNIWETSLSGTCRAIDVGPDNVVLSKDLLNLEIQKEDQGQLRDGYKRGWFSRWFDRVQPF